MEQARSSGDQQGASEKMAPQAHASQQGLIIGDTQLTRLIQTLLRARLALSANNQVLATDRPDLPVSPETSWTTNHSQEIGAIEVMLFELGVDPSQPLAVTAG